MKNAIFASSHQARVRSSELFAIDRYLWTQCIAWLNRPHRQLRRGIAQLLIAVMLSQTVMSPAIAAAYGETAEARARKEAAELAKRRKAEADKKAQPSPTPSAEAQQQYLMAAVGLVLTQVTTAFNGLTGLAYHEANNKLLAAVNGPNGQPRNFELIGSDGVHTAYSNVSNQSGDLRLVTARDDGNGKSLANFNRGEMFFGTSANGVIARVSANGATIQNPWVTLPGETGRVTHLTLDRTNLFSGHVIAVTATGRIYRVNAQAQATLVANLNTPLNGVTVLPNDAAKYGPWAGRILTGAPQQGLIYAVNAQGQSVSQGFGLNPSELLVIPPQENFYAIDSAAQRVWGAPDEAFGTMVGDILVGQAQPGTLGTLRWNGAAFEYVQLAQVGAWQQMVFAPASIAPIADAGRFYDKLAVVRRGLQFNSGRIEGSVWQLNPESASLGNAARVTGDLLVPGTPNVNVSGSAQLVGTLDGTGNPQPTNYNVSLSSTASMRYVVRRVDPIAMPAVSNPPNPTGTREVQLNSSNQNPGNWATVRHLSVSGSPAPVAVPPGTYGDFQINDNGIIVLGVAGATTNSNYNLQSLQVNGASQIQVISPVTLTVRNNTTFNGGSTGAASAPGRLRLYVSQGHLTVNGSSQLYAIARVPQNTVELNNNSLICGALSCNRLNLNGSSVLQICESDVPPPPVNRPPTVNAGADQTLTGLTPPVSLQGTVTDDGQPAGATLSYTWSKVSGPGVVTFSNASALATTVSFDTAGTYTLKLTASDSQLTNDDEVVITINGGNSAPVANAGPDQTISLPTITANLSGTATDDGLPTGSTLSYSWSKISGAGTATFGNANAAASSVTFSSAGRYVLRLTVSDGALSGIDDVTIYVNQPPVVNAGANQTIDLPSNSVTLAGTVTDDGYPLGATLSYAWTKVSGPGTVAFGNAAALTTAATFSVAGVYVLQLTASDSLVSGSATVTVTVNAANLAPTVNAGPDQTISLPLNQVALNGSATDDGKPSGASLSYLWTKVSGPGTVTFSSVNAAATNATFSAGGVYTLRLTVNDTLLSGTDDVVVTVNSAPVVNAGLDQLITLPTASVNLVGSVTDDNLPAPVALSHQWSRISGPGAVTFSAANSLTTTATFAQGGVYVLRLTTSDSLVSGSDDITVTVNNAPTANAGLDQLISLPNNIATLTGNGTDDGLPTGSVLSYAWSKISGPGTVTFSASNAKDTNATFSAAGAYTLRLTVSDSVATGTDDVVVIVNAAPVVNAGPDQAVNYNQAATLNGNATDDGYPTGASLSYAWSQVSGPGVVTFGTPNLQASSATFSAGGVYMLRLSVSDTLTTGTDDIVITVNAAPVVNAGADQLITLPTNSVSLTPTVTDDGLAPGTVALTYLWERASGPGTVTFSNPTAALSAATFSAGGAYTLRLTVSDGALTTTDEINVIVNTAPTANAGLDQLISLPNNTASLIGTGADPDGLPTNGPLTYSWSKVSGPVGGNVTFSAANAASTTATFNSAGAYALRLTVSDSVASASDDVVIGVNDAPTVNAGADQAINFNQSASLSGSASDPDGVPVGALLTYAWAKVSGPIGGNVTFSVANAQATTATFSLAGVYTLRLSVSDSAATGADDVIVTVNGPPTVNAGLDQLVTLPTNQVNLTPVLNDDGLAPGTGVLTSNWTLVSGPGTVAFGNATAAITTATFSAGGIYTLRITVSDGVLSAADDIVVTVNAAPVVSAGANRSVNIADVINLQGSANDDNLPVGSVLIYNWTTVSGPGGVTFVNPTSPTSGVSFSLAGTYVLRLAVSDSAATTTATVSYTVLPSNIAPVVNAGADQTLASIAVIAALQGTATDDGQPNGTLTVAWSKVSGPGTISFSAANSLTTSATFSAPGSYVLRLTASDSVLSTTDDLVVTVNIANQPPTVDAGVNRNAPFNLDNTAILEGYAVDPEGATPNVQWTKINGPGSVTFDDANSLFPVATFSAVGVYTLRLTASDGVSTVFDEMQVNVFDENVGNQPPSLGMDELPSVNWPANTFSDVQPLEVLDDGLPTGSTLSFSWRLVRGPGLATFSAPNAQVSNISFSAPGVYVVRLAVSDSQYVIEGDMELIVRTPPTVNAGPDQTITLPTNSANLAGAVTGGIPSQGTLFPRWEKISGPGVVVFESITSPATVATFGKPGVYVLRLNLREGALNLSDDVTITVLAPAGNQPPQVSAGAAQSIVLPTTVAFLNGTASDDGIPTTPGLSVAWTQVSGPGTTTFDNASAALTSASFSQFGTYVLRITATDGVLTTFDEVTVGVFSSLRPLFVDAGRNQFVDWTAGVRTAGLEGTVIDDSQPVRPFTVKWTKVSGPGTVSFTLDTIRRPVATFSASGVYVLRLTATANTEQAFDEVTIYALTNNQSPVIDQIAEKIINWPANQTGITAVVTDDGLPVGASLTTSWRLVRGPGTVNFNPATGNSTTTTYSAPGRYWMRVAASDTQSIGEQDFFVTVNQLPFVNAGPDAVLSLPNAYIMQATALDDGLPLNESGVPYDLEYVWTQVSGPAAASINSFTELKPAVTFPVAGTYVFQLSVRDLPGSASVSDQVTISVSPQNHAPIVDAGLDRAITLPSNLVTLTGSVVDDGYPNGATATIGWSMVSGPSPVMFSQPNNLVTSVSFSAAGIYTLRLAASDSVLTANDDLIVTVSAVNQAPIVNVGPDQQIYSPTNQLSLIASVTDDGLPANTQLGLAWTKVSGPGEVSFSPANNAATTATFNQQGTYVLRLTANDSLLSASDELTVTVGCSPNTVKLDLAFVMDVSGSYQGQPLVDAKAAAKNLVDRLQLATNDQAALVSFADNGYLNQALTRDAALLKSKIDALAILPFSFVDAGLDVARLELTSTRRQTGSQPVIVLISDGGSGISNGTIQSLRSANIRVISIAFGPAGNLNLNAMRRVASSQNDFFIAPTAADLNLIYAYLAGSLCRNLPPVANAGIDFNVFPPNTGILNGAASDDGVPGNSPLRTTWTQISGPASAEIATPDLLVSEVRFSQPGTYTFRLSVTDSTQSASDEVSVTVLAEPSLAGGSLVLTSTSPTTNPINSQITVTATLKNASDQPLSNFNVRINVAGVNDTNAASANGLTNVNGQFSYSYVGLTPGQDLVTAQAQTPSQSLESNTLSLNWTPVVNILPFSIQGWIGSPLNDSNVSGIVPVTVAPGITVTTGKVEICRAECGALSNCQVIANNVSGGPGAVLTTVDTTLLANGRYLLQLTGSNSTVECAYGVWLNIVGENKPGRVVITDTDITIPLSGIPITIGRRYDSLETNSCPTGDFGHGWSLDMYSTNLVVSPDFDITFTDPGTRRRVTFEFTPQFYGGLTGFLGAPKYTPEAGFYGKLTEQGCGLVAKSGNGWTCPFTLGGKPSVYIYTDPYGRQYKMAADGKLQEIRDLHGNTLTFTPNNIISSEGGRSLSFIRDGQGRITQITAKVNNTTNAIYNYFYNAAGMLEEVELPGIPIRKKYTYSSNRKLLSAKDARGFNEAILTYTTDGRLQNSTDGVGNTTSYSYDLNGGAFTVPFAPANPGQAFAPSALTPRNVGKAAANEPATAQAGPTISYATATTITFPDSGVEVLRYDNYGLLLAETDTLGQTSYYTYDSKRNMLTKTNDLGQTTAYGYDANGNVISVTDPLGNTRTASYNGLSLPVSDANALNQPKTIMYDGQNSPVEIRDSIGLLGKFQFDSSGNLTSRADGEGGVTNYVYDQFGNLEIEVDELGFSTAFQYDDFGRMITSTNARGLRENYTYDLLGRLKEQKDNITNIADKYEYDGNDNLTAYTDRNNKRTAFQYDEANRLIKVTHPDLTTEEFTYNHRDQLLTAKDQRLFVTTYRYDTEGRLDRITHPDGKFISATYDEIDRITSVTDERGFTTQYGYDPACGCAERLTTITDPYNKVTTFLYDPAGRRIAVIDANGHKTQFVYDARGRMTKLIYPDQTVREYGYDLANRLLTDKDETGKITRNEYNVRGDLGAVVDALNQRTTYAYNEMGSLALIQDAKGAIRRFEFDLLERLTKRIHPNVGDEIYTYDPVNNLKTRRDGRGKTTSYNYDDLNRLTSVVPDASLAETTISYSYFPNGYVHTMTDGTGTTTYDINSRRALISKATPTNGTLTYDYDDALNLKLIQSSNANGIWVEYVYDKKDRLESVNDRRLTPGLTTYTYDDADNLKTTTLPNGVKTEYTYDATDLIKQVLTTKGATTLARYDYTHKPTGHRDSVTELNGRRVEYEYDDAWRLVRETITGASQAQHNGTIGYVYDKVGNRLQRNSTVGAIPSQAFSYNAADQMSGETYDLNGNLTSSADGRTYAYDFEDRLKTVTLGGQTTSYAYDGNGNRVRKTVGSATTNYLNGNLNINVAEEIVNGQVKQAFTHGNAPIGQRPVVGATSFFQHDAGTHTRQLTNATGAVTDGYDYDAFGEALGQTGVTSNQYRYRGEQYEPELDGYNLRHRYYQPGKGRFMSFDLVEGYPSLPGSLHRYSYVSADPVNYLDPLGLISTVEYGVVNSSHQKKPVPAYQQLGVCIRGIIQNLAEEIVTDAATSLLLGAAADVAGSSISLDPMRSASYSGVADSGSGANSNAIGITANLRSSKKSSPSGLTVDDLIKKAAEEAEKWGKKKGLGPKGGGPSQGKAKHRYAEQYIRDYIARTGEHKQLEVEQPYFKRQPIKDRIRGSAVPDVYDPKTGKAYDFKFDSKSGSGVSKRQSSKNRKHVRGCKSTTGIRP